MNSHQLAVISPLFGARSETFIRRHVIDLLPDRTVCIYGSPVEETKSEWNFTGPSLHLGDVFHERRMHGMEEGGRFPAGFNFTGAVKEDIYGFLNRHKVKVLLTQYLDCSLPWLQVAEDLGLRIYAHAHGYDVSRLLLEDVWRTEYQKLKQADGIITVNQVSKQRLMDLGISEDSLHVIPCGVSKPSWTEKTTKAEKSIRCLAVGRMVGKKAPIYTLESFRIASKLNPDLHLDFIGDGELMPAVIHFIQVAGLAEKVTLHGSKPSSFVHEMMEHADIFLHHAVENPVTGDEEGLPVAILEAMQHGLPVVSTFHAGIPDAVVNGVTGYLVEEGDTQGMADKIEILASRKNTRKEFAMLAQDRVEKKFSWEIEKQKLLQVTGMHA